MEKLKKIKSLGSGFMLAVAAFIWGTAFVAQSTGLEAVGNFTFLALRSCLAVVFLTPVSLYFYYKNKQKLADTEDIRYKSFFSRELIIGGVLCGIALYFASFFQQYGIVLSGVGKSGFLTTLYILIVPLLGLFFKKRVKPVLWICIVIATVGMYFLCVTETGGVNLGDFLLIICAFFFSTQIMLVDHFIQKVDGVRLSLVQFFVVAVLSAITMLFVEDVDPDAIGDIWFSVFYAGVMSSGIAYTLQIVAQKNLNATVASLLMSLESVFAALAGAAFGERLSPGEILGCCLVFLAVIVAQLPIGKKTVAK